MLGFVSEGVLEFISQGYWGTKTRQKRLWTTALLNMIYAEISNCRYKIPMWHWSVCFLSPQIKVWKPAVSWTSDYNIAVGLWLWMLSDGISLLLPFTSCYLTIANYWFKQHPNSKMPQKHLTPCKKHWDHSSTYKVPWCYPPHKTCYWKVLDFYCDPFEKRFYKR